MATYPGATWRPGPKSKQGYSFVTRNACVGLICHSAVGPFAASMARLDSSDRASWHFTVTKDGRVWQHYDSEAVAWHAGSPYWNARLIGIEHEGGADTPETVSEPLTPAQLAASVALVRWLAERHGFALVRREGDTGALFEHNQVYATACPSGRIPWAAYVAAAEEDEMKPFLAWATDTKRVYLVGPWGAAWITDPDDVATLEKLYGPMSVVLHETTLHAIHTVAVVGA